MSEKLTDNLLEAATAMNRASEILEKLKAEEIPTIAKAHLSVATSGLLHARRQLDMMVKSIPNLPVDEKRPEWPDVWPVSKPPHRD